MQRRTTELVGTLAPLDTQDLLDVLGRVRAGADCDLVELRLDLLPDAEARLDDLLAAAPVPVVATCRRTPSRAEGARLALLARAAERGAAWIDVEHDVASAEVPRGQARVLRSAHLESLPPDPTAFVDALLADADGAKLVVFRSADTERVEILELIRRFEGRLAAHAIDAPATRFASALVGGLLTYAALGRRAGFGFDLPDVRRFAALSGRGRTGPGTRAFLLLGRSVDASVSPWMLNRAFAEGGSDLLSLAWSCEDVETVLEGALRLGWAGAAVTMPFKERALAWVKARGGALGPDARRIGSVNTVLFARDGAVSAENTDLGGLLDALRAEPAADCRGRPGLVLGAGGAARAAVCAVRDLGGEPWIWSRKHDRAAALAAALPAEDARVAASLDEALDREPALVVDATPAGPPGGEPLIDPRRLAGTAVVMDMLVARRPTALLAAADRTHDVREGVVMLAGQAARQVELLTGERPPLDSLLEVGRARLAVAARKIVLVGLRGAGKSSLGRAVGALLELPFVDLDDVVTDQTGETPDAFIASGRESDFRRFERKNLREAVAREAVVIATGGGASLHVQQLRDLARDAFVVFVDASDEVLLARLAAVPRAPLTNLAPPLELARLRGARIPTYRSLAALRLDTGEASIDQLAARIADRALGLSR